MGTHRHTDTQDNYCNPRRACATRVKYIHPMYTLNNFRPKVICAYIANVTMIGKYKRNRKSLRVASLFVTFPTGI